MGAPRSAPAEAADRAGRVAPNRIGSDFEPNPQLVPDFGPTRPPAKWTPAGIASAVIAATA
jgi:hypothetical protein